MCLSPFFCNGSSLENMFVSKQYQRSFYITFYLVISFMPLTGKHSKRFLLIRSSFLINFPWTCSAKNLCLRNLRSDASPYAIMKVIGSPRPLYIRFSLNPKSRHVEFLFLRVIFLNVLPVWILLFLHISKGAPETKQMHILTSWRQKTCIIENQRSWIICHTK